MANEPIGDNKEFAIAAISDVTIYFNNVNGYTSANDTETEKYFNSNRSRTEYCLRTDQVVQIVSLANVTFTDPITVLINGSITEREMYDRRYTGSFDKMVIRTTVVNTNIKLRVRG